MGQIKNAEWLRQRNERARARLLKAVPEGFPKPVLRHALAARWIPELPSRAVELYWRAHPLRADRLARALARRSGAPQGWGWSEDESFRTPPAPYREERFAKGPGHCCICGQPVFRFGWHRDFERRRRRPRAMARALCRGLEVLERAERSGPPLEAPAGTPLRDDRTAAPARRRGRPPRPALPGFAPAPRPALARPPRLLGHAEPAGHQPARPCREMRRGGGRPGPLADAPALPFGRRRGVKTRWPGQARP